MKTKYLVPTVVLSAALALAACGAPTVTATDQGVGIARVWFFVDGVPAGHSDSAPCTFTVNPADRPSGPHTLSAMAVDAYANPYRALAHAWGSLRTTPRVVIFGTDNNNQPQDAVYGKIG